MFFADISFTFLTLLSHLLITALWINNAALVPAPVFVYQLQLKELQMPGRWGHSNHLGIVLCSAYFTWSISRQVHKECEIGPKRSNLYQVQLEVGVCTRQMHYMSINPGCHRTQQAAILMFCNMLCSGRLFDPAHQHLLWSYYKIQWFLVCHYHLSCHHGA